MKNRKYIPHVVKDRSILSRLKATRRQVEDVDLRDERSKRDQRCRDQARREFEEAKQQSRRRSPPPSYDFDFDSMRTNEEHGGVELEDDFM